MTETESPSAQTLEPNIKDAASIPSLDSPEHPLASEHTSNFPDILRRLGISLLVSTYQAGRLVALRAEGNKLNTHFAAMPKPMGIAAREDGSQFIVGCNHDIRWFRNVPALSQRLESTAEPHDACYVPAANHVTGGIDIHEMALNANNELWVINTRFSCLCKVESENNFKPVWHPPWVTALAAEDRCHLNGLGMYNNRPRFVTALGRTNEAGGWRSNKVDGGLMLDLQDNRMITDGLSMPHSPRWYNNKLWVLESGKGQLCCVDPDSGKRDVIATIKGFTRGLEFVGPLAFIGVSQVRESATFSGLEITEKYTAEERECGVWVVNIQTGDVIAWLRFTRGVNEIFALARLPCLYPELLAPDSELIKSTWVVPDQATGEGWHNPSGWIG